MQDSGPSVMGAGVVLLCWQRAEQQALHNRGSKPHWEAKLAASSAGRPDAGSQLHGHPGNHPRESMPNWQVQEGHVIFPQEYIIRRLQQETDQISEDERLIQQYEEDTQKMKSHIKTLQTRWLGQSAIGLIVFETSRFSVPRYSKLASAPSVVIRWNYLLCTSSANTLSINSSVLYILLLFNN